ncbi:uncharacterized protein L969DRAFT_83722 [Mixia osmundae IAM 14324]|nr:uncharacterized protein L969DRAFT_83722 [Mixia osmundae IAM 14324]KEI41870.1 hypothetical protein L969DRAFT_83722 [Mixia osmundae IAM 14324]
MPSHRLSHQRTPSEEADQADDDDDEAEDEAEEEIDEDEEAIPRARRRNGKQVASGKRNSTTVRAGSQASDEGEMRHGFAEQYISEEGRNQLERVYFLYWNDLRHESAGTKSRSNVLTMGSKGTPDWRNRDRLKTAVASLLLCLRIGFDPPDAVKTDPCAKTECWIDPFSLNKDKVMDAIGRNLQLQYENLAGTSKTRYKFYPDPTVEDTKKLCVNMRKQAKNERVLFHYNGHGVPKPTASGEIWVFNKMYTQYIPVSLLDLLSWLSSPTIFVWDCSAAGNIVNKVIEFGARKDAEIAAQRAAAPPPPPPLGPGSSTPQPQPSQPVVMPDGSIAPSAPFAETLQLAACEAHQSLPMNPDLPADLLTSCLTSPIEVALQFFILRNPLKTNLSLDLALKIPGRLQDRKTPLGELGWIFTAVTDTIAWNMLPAPLFLRLFRHDLVVAALFRGFLLAERIMRHYDCTPVSVPKLPPTHNHPLWDSWDLAVDRCLVQLPAILEASAAREKAASEQRPLPPEVPFVPSRFFSDELTAFEIWLDHGTARTTGLTASEHAKNGRLSDTLRPLSTHPEQLPIVLQVLLSQAHRLRALILLCKFLDLGPWAVNLALSIGIFPYVLKLLQAPSADLRPPLIYIWARILGVYRTCQEDLIRQVVQPTRREADLPFHYFVHILAPHQNSLPIPNVSEHRAMCAFILSILCRDFPTGQAACLDPRANVMEVCLAHLSDFDPLLRQWAPLVIAQLWDNFDEAKGRGLKSGAHEMLAQKLSDPVPEVRAAALYALGTLVGASGGEGKRVAGKSLSSCSPNRTDISASERIDIELGVAMAVLKALSDGSPMVRSELVVLLSAIVIEHQGHLVVAAYQTVEDERKRSQGRTVHHAAEERQRALEQSLRNATETQDVSSNPHFRAMIFSCIYKTLLDLASDPHPDVADKAGIVIDFVHDQLLISPFVYAAQSALEPIVRRSAARLSANTAIQRTPSEGSRPRSSTPSGTTTPAHAGKRATSLAAAVKSLTGLGSPDHARTQPPSRAESNGGPEAVQEEQTHRLRKNISADSLIQTQAKLRKAAAAINGSPDSLTIEEAQAQLIASDEERLQQRRSSPTVTHAGVKSPSGAELPLRSDFFDWSCRYFTEPQMKPAEADEPGSVNYNERLWRRERNEKVVMSTQPLREAAAASRWDELTGFWGNDMPPTSILFHQYESHLVASDSARRLTVYDWKTHARLHRFSNDPRSVPGGSNSRITSLNFINEDDVAFLLTGSSDGNVRIFRNYSTKAELVTAFRGLIDIIKSTHDESGLVTDWQQGRGHLVVGGNSKTIRIWDAPKEVCVQDIATRSNSCLTSLTSDQVGGNVLIAGFGDGVVRVYDRREGPRTIMKVVWRGFHPAWVQQVSLQKGGTRELVSGSRDGTVCVWDIRYSQPLRIVQAHQGGMVCMATHEHAPVFATASEYDVVKVWNMTGTEPISKFRNSAGLLTQRITGTSSMAFHPHQMLLATGADDGHLNLYSCDTREHTSEWA